MRNIEKEPQYMVLKMVAHNMVLCFLSSASSLVPYVIFLNRIQ